MDKPWYTSKTLITNVVALLVTAASIFGIGITEETSASLVMVVMAVVNIVLRFTTKGGVTT